MTWYYCVRRGESSTTAFWQHAVVWLKRGDECSLLVRSGMIGGGMPNYLRALLDLTSTRENATHSLPGATLQFFQGEQTTRR